MQEKRLIKPSKPHLMGDMTILTPEEADRRRAVARQLEEMGISITKFDGEEHESAAVMQAILLANQGKEIPKELRERIRS